MWRCLGGGVKPLAYWTVPGLLFRRGGWDRVRNHAGLGRFLAVEVDGCARVRNHAGLGQFSAVEVDGWDRAHIHAAPATSHKKLAAPWNYPRRPRAGLASCYCFPVRKFAPKRILSGMSPEETETSSGEIRPRKTQ